MASCSATPPSSPRGNDALDSRCATPLLPPQSHLLLLLCVLPADAALVSSASLAGGPGLQLLRLWAPNPLCTLVLTKGLAGSAPALVADALRCASQTALAARLHARTRPCSPVFASECKPRKDGRACTRRVAARAHLFPVLLRAQRECVAVQQAAAAASGRAARCV